MPAFDPAETVLPEAAQRDVAPAVAEYLAQGFARLGPVATPEILAALRARSDDLMLGRVVYPGLFFQIDAPTGRYEDLTYGRGWEGPSLAYRKVEKLEKDPLFWAYLRNPLFQRIAQGLLGDEVLLYRAVLFNKAAHGGSPLPFHQDGGRFWGLSEDPTLQIWTALDDAPEEAGCLEAVPGSHAAGLVTPLGGVVPADRFDPAEVEPRVVRLPARAGEAILVHNHVWHRSGVNHTARPRRGFTVCFLRASTRCLRQKRAPRAFARVFEAEPMRSPVAAARS